MIKGFNYYGSAILGYKLACPKNYVSNKNIKIVKNKKSNVKKYVKSNFNYSKVIKKVLYR